MVNYQEHIVLFCHPPAIKYIKLRKIPVLNLHFNLYVDSLILGTQGAVAVWAGLLGHGDVSLCKHLPTFRRKAVPSYVWTEIPTWPESSN